MKYVQILASTLAFVAAAALHVQLRQQPGQVYLYVVLFLLCGANLLSRLTETSIGDQIAEAEEKMAKPVLRRLAKVMPELLNEYFKATATKHAEKLSDVVVAPLVERDAKGNTVVTVPPGCTAADVNAAVGATIAHSAPKKEEFNAFSTDGILIEGVLLPLKPGSLLVDKETRHVTCTLDLYKDSRNDWKSQFEQIIPRLLPATEPKVVKAYHPELAKAGIKYLHVKTLGTLQPVAEGEERWFVSLEAFGNMQALNLLSP